MNILIINHYAGSSKMGMEFRPYYFAREWIKMGHRVDIIAADFSHLRHVNPTVERDFQEDVIDGIHYHWVKSGSYEGNGAKRAMTMFRFVSKLWIHAKRIISELQPDAVIASSTYPLDTYVGQRLRKLSKKKVKLIHEVHDMWPISPIEIGGMSPKHPFIRVMQIAEDSFCKNSDLVVSLLPAAKDYFCEHGMPADNFRHIPNGVVLEEWENPMVLPKQHQEVFKSLRAEDNFVLCFFGSHTRSYALDILIEAVNNVEQDNIRVVFVGDGFFKEDLIKMTENRSDVFHFLPPIPKQSIPSLFKEIDAVYVAIANNNMARFGICMNKLFDSMMGGKTILYAVDAPNNYILDYNCGISVKPGNVGELSHGINDLVAMTGAERQIMGDNGKDAVLKNFNYKVLSQKFIEVLEE